MFTTTPYPSKARIHEIFSHLATGFLLQLRRQPCLLDRNGHTLGNHPSKSSFLSFSLPTIAKAIEGPMKLRVKNIIGGETGEWAVIEMEAVEGTKCKNGMVYD
jgi:hypothetical protein